MTRGPAWLYRAHNVAWRILGLWAVLCGTGFAAWAGWLLTHPHSPMDVNASPATAVGTGLVMLLAAAIGIGLGVLLLRARTYRPDLGDVLYFVDPFVARTQDRTNRHWWTGDPKGRATRADA